MGWQDDPITGGPTQPAFARAGAAPPLIDIEFPGSPGVFRDPARSWGADPIESPAPPLDAGLQSLRDAEAAALQGVSPHATSKLFGGGVFATPKEVQANKPVRLGDLDEGAEFPVYRTPAGQEFRVNPKTDFMARDPDTGRMAVYARNAEVNEGPLTSASRLIAPYMTVGPLPGGMGSAPPRAVAAAPVRQPAAPQLPLSSAQPPASVQSALRPSAPPAVADVSTQIARRRADTSGADAAAFDRMGVRKPPIAFMQGPMASVGKQIADTPWIGAPIKNGLDASLQGLATATENLASRFGSASTPETAGAAIRGGIERFKDARPADVVERAAQGYTPAERSAIIRAPVRDTSLKTKQAALYERAWAHLPAEMQQGRAAEGLPRVLGGMPETAAVLNGIQGRNRRMINASGANADAASRPVASSGLLGQMIEAMQNPKWRAALQTMRDVRSEFRRLASGMADTERNTLRVSDMERIQSSVTRDMVALLERNVEAYERLGQTETAQQMRRAITEFRRADRFTRLAAERMETIERLFNAPSAEALYRSVMNAALSKGKGDLQKLRVLHKTLRGEELDDVAAAVIRQLGEPLGSARGAVQEMGFSPSSALTRWSNMTPEARALIFGHEHAQALDDWFRVTSRLANVEALANTSRTATNLVNAGLALGSAGLALNGHTALLGAALTVGGGLSVLLSRPAYVRWVTTYAELRARALQASSGSAAPRLASHLNLLRQAAERDAQLMPVYRQLAAENGIGEGRQQDEKKQ